jgi:hypothetical protein
MPTAKDDRGRVDGRLQAMARDYGGDERSASRGGREEGDGGGGSGSDRDEDCGVEGGGGTACIPFVLLPD